MSDLATSRLLIYRIQPRPRDTSFTYMYKIPRHRAMKLTKSSYLPFSHIEYKKNQRLLEKAMNLLFHLCMLYVDALTTIRVEREGHIENEDAYLLIQNRFVNSRGRCLFPRYLFNSRRISVYVVVRVSPCID